MFAFGFHLNTTFLSIKPSLNLVGPFVMYQALLLKKNMNSFHNHLFIGLFFYARLWVLEETLFYSSLYPQVPVNTA